MKKMTTRATASRWVFVLFGTLFLALAFVGSSEAERTGLTINQLTFSQPVALPGVVLPAGSYTFESLILGGDIVRVSDRRGGTVRFTGFTQRVMRPPAIPANSAVALGEAPAGTAPPIIAWYPIGHAIGHQFMYR